MKNLKAANKPEEASEEIKAMEENVYAALCDDLNTPVALSHLFDAVKIINNAKEGKRNISAKDKEILDSLFTTVLTDILGIMDENFSNSAGEKKVIEGLMDIVLKERAKAKAEKDWAKSDFIRDSLKELGISVKDTKEGAEWSL